MKISLSILKQSLRLWSFGLVVTFAMLLPCSAFCQEEQEEQEINSGSNSPNQQSERPGPAVGDAPWGNSAGSTIGTRSAENPNSTSSPLSSNPSVNKSGFKQRPGSPLAGGGDPGGNPDVPFDKNINLAFLAAGLMFAFWVGKKRFSANTAKLKNNK